MDYKPNTMSIQKITFNPYENENIYIKEYIDYNCDDDDENTITKNSNNDNMIRNYYNSAIEYEKQFNNEKRKNEILREKLNNEKQKSNILREKINILQNDNKEVVWRFDELTDNNYDLKNQIVHLKQENQRLLEKNEELAKKIKENENKNNKENIERLEGENEEDYNKRVN